MGSNLSKSERTRNFIVETSSGIFNKKGFAGTSMSDLTEATGLTKGSIYGNFENKEEVALAVFDFNYGKVSAIINGRISRAGSYYDKLMVYAQVYDRFSSDAFPEGGCPVLNTAVEADDTHGGLRAKAVKAISDWKKNITGLLEEGVKAGEFRADFDSNQLALSIIALIEGGIMIAKVTGIQSNLDKVLKTVKMLLDQIKN